MTNGIHIPQLGLGTWPMNDAEAEIAVAEALNTGYRLIDTAENYANECGVGAGIRQSGVKRSDIFVTTKFNRQWHSVDGVRRACEESLKRLQLDYLDLLLIHWPNPDQDHYLEAYDGLLAVQQAGLVRSIGTSNFKVTHLKRLLDHGHVPVLNQIQLDPYHERDTLVDWHRQHGIVTQTWRPLGFGSSLLKESVLHEIGEAHGRSPAQIVLRWTVQQGFATVPKSADARRMADNLRVFDFCLSDIDMGRVSGLRRDNPDMFDADTFGH
jgi:2,5-diketo-D-gluconate reductase A